MPTCAMLATASSATTVGQQCRPRRAPFANAVPHAGQHHRGPAASTSGRFLAPALPSPLTLARPPSRSMSMVVCAVEDEQPVKYNKQFGYSRKDIIIITFGLIGLGYAMYYGLQAIGMEAGMAGNYVQLAIFLGICIGYISTYIFRVATKQMTYVKQLEAYEDAVMQKRVEEMTEDELADLLKSAEADKERRAGRK